MTVTHTKRRDGSGYTVRLRYDWQERAHRHHVTPVGPHGRLWCERCGSQCGATIHLAAYLATPHPIPPKGELTLCL
jgi:hypothetical protein